MVVWIVGEVMGVVMVMLVLVVMIVLAIVVMVVIVLVYLSQVAVKFCDDGFISGMVTKPHLSEVAVKCELLEVVLNRSH